MSDASDNRFYREKQGQLASKEIVAALRSELSRSDGANVIVRSGHLRQALDEIERRSSLAGDEQAEAWESVWEKLRSFNPKFYEQGRNGEEAALQEIDRLQRGAAPEPPVRPSAWYRVVKSPDTPMGPSETDVELAWGDWPPGAPDDVVWQPLYARAAQPPRPGAEDDPLVVWVLERLENCQEIAATKTGADRDGWLDDEQRFAEILRRLACSAPPPALEQSSPWAREQYQKIQDFVIRRGLYRGQNDNKSHADIVLELAELGLPRAAPPPGDDLRIARNLLIDAQNFIGPTTVWRDEELMLRLIREFIERTRPTKGCGQ
jgi:hypothetical protein